MKQTHLLISSLLLTGSCFLSCQEKVKQEAHYKYDQSNTPSPSPQSPVPTKSQPRFANGVADSVTSITEYWDASTSSSAAVENPKDTASRFIRTAELKFRTPDVTASTYRVEDITNRFGGHVTYTNLASTVDHKSVSPMTDDSALEIIYYTVSNTMTLRVPNTKLDTTLKSLTSIIDYMDYRVITANDASLQIMEDELAEQRVDKHQQRLTNTIDTRGRKLGETEGAENNLLSSQEQGDQARMNRMGLMKQVKYSTVNLYIYQREAVKRQMIANENNYEYYEPGMGMQLWGAVKTGWSGLEFILIQFTKLWAILLLALLVYIFIYRKYKHKWRKSFQQNS